MDAFEPTTPRVPVWPALAPFVGRLADLLDAPPERTRFPANPEALARAAEAFTSAAEEVYGVMLRLDREALYRVWPEQRSAEEDGTASLDLFVEQHLVAPDHEAAIADAPLLIYGLGAVHATWLMRHAACRWIGGPQVTLPPPIDPQIGVDAALIRFPFGDAVRVLVEPGQRLWLARIGLEEAPPPRGLADTMDDVKPGARRLYPDGALELFATFEERGVEATLAALAPLIEAEPSNGLLLNGAAAVAAHLPDLSEAVRLSRRLVAVHPRVKSRYYLADLLACQCVPEADAEAEALFRAILEEQPMMNRARLKLGYLLARMGRDEGVDQLRQVAGTWGSDADEAKSALTELGIEFEAEAGAAATDEAAPPSDAMAFGLVSDLAQFLPDEVRAEHGGLACWIYADGASTTVFERLPESELALETSSAISSGLQRFCQANLSELVKLLGTNRVSISYHVGGKAEDIARILAEDGLVCRRRIKDGQLVASN